MNTWKETLEFDDRPLRLIGIPILGFTIPFFFDANLFDFKVFLPQWMQATVFTFVTWQCCGFVIVSLRRKFPNYQDAGKRLGYQALILIILTFAICAFLNAIFKLLGVQTAHASTFKAYSVSFMSTAMMASTYEAIYFYQRLKKTLVESEQLKRENIQSQLETLKNQVNPHFLFNSLNTLVSIIPDDPEVAVEFVHKLSKVYRYILEIKELETISLAVELDFLHAYVFLQKIRFGENLSVSINIPDSLMQNSVVPLSLQVLVENAVKHNVVSAQRPLHIEIFTEHNNRLIVRNNLQKKNQVMDSTQTGLKNISNRYRLISEQLVDTIVTANSFIVSIPILPSH